MTRYCSMCGRECDDLDPDYTGAVWCDCCNGPVPTTARKPERHR